MGLDWNRLRILLTVAESGSLSAAARGLGLTQPTVGRQVDALERSLGVTLIERVGRGIQLTAAGEEVVDGARQMKDSADRLALLAEGRSAALEGTVRVTASEVISAYLLPDVFIRLRQTHPGIRIEVVASNETKDLQRREADIAVRNFRPTEAELMVKKLPDSWGCFYASKQWVKEHGMPKTREELADSDFLGFEDVSLFVDMLRQFEVTVAPERFVFTSESHLIQWEMARRGHGLVVMMSEIGDRDSGMVRVMPEGLTFPVPIFLTCHRELKTSARIRAVFDAIAEGWGPGQMHLLR